jgi:hypothetical protein
MPRKTFDPCKANACKIQACLKDNNYIEEKCLDVLEEMRQCCIKWKPVSLCCEGIDIDKSHNPTKDVSNKKKN